jgi:ATP synthase F1 delta subunit
MKIDPQLKQELKEYILKREKESGRLVELVSAYKLGEDEVLSVQASFDFLRNDHMVNVVDKSIIAGVILKFGSKMIDLSVRGQLDQIKKRVSSL